MLIHLSDDPSTRAEARIEIVANERLSFAARGLLLWLLKQGPDCDLNAEKIAAASKAVRGNRGERVVTVRAIFRELQSEGYMIRRLQGGGRIGTVLEVFDVAQDSAVRGPAPIPEPKDPVNRRGQVVYIIGEPGSSIVKIGTTSNVKKRLRGIQTSSPMRLEVRWSHHGGGELETALHAHFRSRQIQGEWFDFGTADPVSVVDKFVRKLDREWYDEADRQLRMHGAVIDAPFPLRSVS